MSLKTSSETSLADTVLFVIADCNAHVGNKSETVDGKIANSNEVKI